MCLHHHTTEATTVSLALHVTASCNWVSVIQLHMCLIPCPLRSICQPSVDSGRQTAHSTLPLQEYQWLEWQQCSCWVTGWLVTQQMHCSGQPPTISCLPPLSQDCFVRRATFQRNGAASVTTALFLLGRIFMLWVQQCRLQGIMGVQLGMVSLTQEPRAKNIQRPPGLGSNANCRKSEARGCASEQVVIHLSSQ